ANPSLCGILAGYIAERKLWDWFAADRRITSIRKDDDHDRLQKGDLVVTYLGYDFRIEVKSLQTNSIVIFDADADTWVKKVVQESAAPQASGKRQRRKWIESEAFKVLWRKGPDDALYRGGIQCDASDRRSITVAGQEVSTTNLRVGEFDLLAACLFAFREKWDFGFILNRDLPRSTYAKYPEAVRNELIKTMIPVTWPLPENFVSDPFILLDRLVAEKGLSPPGH
ncbi:MAG: hypothetical protein ACRELF_03530, partial [Gemmataceae bacterium]